MALGISLGGSHLSDITLTIIANIYWSIFNNIHKTYYTLFTNKHLNVDQLIRFMLFHYFTPFYYLYLIQMHVLFCHESWDTDSGENTYEDRSVTLVSWLFDAFVKETQDAWFYSHFVVAYYLVHFFDGESVNYYYFERWNICELDEIRFYGVSPHWYFRPFMGLLTMAPTHYEGLMWFGLWLLLLAFLPLIHNFYFPGNTKLLVVPIVRCKLQSLGFLLFILSLYIATLMLPCGRYYYELEGGYIGNV